MMKESYQLDWGGVMSIVLDFFYDGDDRQSYQLDWRGGGRLVQSYCWLSWEGFGPQAGRRPCKILVYIF